MSTSEPSVRRYSSAAQYIQGPGALTHLGGAAARLGSRAHILIDEALFVPLAKRIADTMAKSSVEARSYSVSGEVTWRYIHELTAQTRSDLPTCIVGVGGGKTIDLAKGVAHELSLPIVTVPTIASNDSPASRLIAIYDDYHKLSEVLPMKVNPQCVVVDSNVIIGAPTRFLSAGIGDAIAKYREVRACWESQGLTPQGTRALRAAYLLAEGSYRILRSSAENALQDARRGTITHAFEDTIEAVILLSGLAFENGGLSVAHAMTRAFMVLAPDRLHGEHVAYGLIAQNALQGDSDDQLADLSHFLRSIELPISLADLGVCNSVDNLNVMVEQTLDAPHLVNFPEVVTGESLKRAIQRIEALNA